jgi:hypothetical protein
VNLRNYLPRVFLSVEKHAIVENSGYLQGSLLSVAVRTDVDYAFPYFHFVDVSSDKDVSEEHTTPIFWAEI